MHRSGVYYSAALTGIRHSPRRPLGAEEGPRKVRVQNPPPLLVGELEELARRIGSGGVIHENVHATQSFRQLIYHVCGSGQITQIESAHVAATSHTLDLQQRLLGPGLVFVVGDAYVETVLRQLLRSFLADPESEAVTIATGLTPVLKRLPVRSPGRMPG